MSEGQTQQLAFRLLLCDTLSGEQCSAFAGGLTLDAYKAALSAACPTARYHLPDVVEDCSADSAKPVIHINFPELDVASMHELRDQVLSGDLDTAMGHELHLQAKLELRADRSEFAEQYEQSVLAFETLTPHQREKVDECTSAGANDVHLKAPAGAGKTFVALHRVLDALRSNSSCYVLFAARNEALALFAASWIGKRANKPGERNHIISRLHILHEPFDQGVHAVVISGRRVWMQLLPSSASHKCVQYSLLVIDEAHHLYSDAAARSHIESFVTCGVTRRLLLSDYSQSLGRGVLYPAGLRDVILSEVVRCSQRIVAGAMAFQLGGEEKLLTKCHHESTGPPLKSFLFDVPTSSAREDCLRERFQAYAEHTSRALGHVVAAFPSFNLHNRLAIVVPDLAFLESLRPELLKMLGEVFPARRFQLVSATTASSDLGFHCASDEDEVSEVLPHTQCQEDGEWLVYDTIGQLDGLERLVVLGVGLDSVISLKDGAAISDGTDGSKPAMLERRSMLYRAITRAHLMVLIVNEFLRGGWLEFLGSVRLRSHESFDRKAELERSELQAVEGVVKEDLTMAVGSAAETRGLNLEDDAMSTLAKTVAILQERGLSLDAAVNRILQQWELAAQQVMDSLRCAAAQVSGEIAFRHFSTPSIDDALAAPVTLALFKAEIANLPAAAMEQVKKAYKKSRDAQAKEALQAAMGPAQANAISSEVADVLQSLIATATERNQSLEAAAHAVIRDWEQITVLVTRSLETSVAELQVAPPQKVLDAMLTSATVATLNHGEASQQAVQHEIQKWLQREADEQVSKALEMQAGVSHPVCRAGSRVQLVQLKKKELIGKEGHAMHFKASSGRWSVQLDASRLGGSTKPIAVKPENLRVTEQDSPEAPSLSDVMAMLRTSTNKAVAEGQEIDAAAASQVLRWRTLQCQAASALEQAALARQLHVGTEVASRIVQKIVQELWQLEPDVDLATCTENSEQTIFETAVDSALGEWERSERLQQEESSQIASAIEAAASAERLLLTDAAAATLQRRVLSMLRRGTDLQTAVNLALHEWHQQVVRKQVQQTVWDPSGNSTRRVTGVVRFMPFKSNGADCFDSFMLATVFAMLPFYELGAFSRVCKRWRSAATDPSWKPELVVYAWGDADVTGLSVACPKPTLLDFSLAKQIIKIACSDAATYALTDSGNVWFWGKSWLMGEVDDCVEPTLIQELQDVVSVTASPAGYFHGRSRRPGHSGAAVTRQGSLYTWGLNLCGQLLHHDRVIPRPRHVVACPDRDLWQPITEPVLLAACGLDYLALCVRRLEGSGTTSVLTFGCWNYADSRRGTNLEWLELRGIALRQLEAGSFHCCALSTSGELYSWGHPIGADHSNGNLLGHGAGEMYTPQPPRQVTADGLGPIAEVSCSTYTTVSITVDGRAFSWGDADGDALGHTTKPCNVPVWLPSLRWQRVSHGSSAYTNAAVATDEGRVFVWGGNYWEGGIAEGRSTQGPSEVKWKGVPSCYRCHSVALAHRHGFLIFRKEP